MSGSFMKTPHAISSKADGSMNGIDGKLDFKNIEKFLTQNNMPSKMVCMNQVHGNNVVRVSSGTELVVIETDGLVTDEKGLCLNVVTADCLPILFYDPVKQAIGVAHAGRKGLEKNIINNLLMKLQTEFACNLKDIQVMIGPSIEKTCYEVNEEIIKEFQKTFPTFKDYFSNQQGKFFLDLRNVALQCLQKEGILRENIVVSEECTKCNSDTFYSYRRGDQMGRFVSSICLV